MRCYALGSNTRGAEILASFSEGVKGSEFIRQGDKYNGDCDIAVWGILRGAKELRQKCKASGHTYYAVDHAYIGRELNFRVTRNGFQQTEVFERDKFRWSQLCDKFRPVIKDWRRGGKYILLAMSSTSNYEYFDEIGWEDRTRYYLRQVTDRPVITRKKVGLGERLHDQLSNAWCVVTHTSMVAVDAVLAGVPVFVTGPSIARPVGLGDLSRVEEPVFPERTAWMHSLAYAQFNEKEMKQGKVVPWLDENPVTYDHHGW